MSASGWIDLKPPPEPPAVVLACNGCDAMIGTHQAPANWIDPASFFCIECLRAGAMLGVRRDPASLRPLDEVLANSAVLRGVPQTRTDAAEVLATVEPAVPEAVSVGGSSGGGPLSTDEPDPLIALLRGTSVETADGGDAVEVEAGVSLSEDDEPEPAIVWEQDDPAERDRARNRAAVLDGTYDPATAPMPEGF